MTDTSKKHIKVTLNLIQINLKPPTIASQLPVTKKILERIQRRRTVKKMINFHHKEDFLGDRREVTRILGMGSFGHVVSCYNWETRQMEAVKLINHCPRAIEYAEQEIKILKRLKVFDPDRCGIVRFYESFLHRGIICLSFEVLDQDLKAYIQDVQIQSGLCGLPLVDVRAITCQMLVALDVLACNGVIHCDIKPENIMVVDCNHQPVTVKLVDFGAAQNSSDICPENLIQTLWYSSPEVMLDCPYNEAIDMWALGMTAAEVVLGNPLYPEINTFNMLRSIIKTQGMLPNELLDDGEGTHSYFCQEDHGRPVWRLKTVWEFHSDTGYHHDEELDTFDSLDDMVAMAYQGNNQKGSDQELFVDLIKKMLHLDPQRRVTAEDALKHPFFAHGFKTPAALQNVGTEHIGIIKLGNTDSQGEIYDIPAEIYLQSP